MPMSFTVISSIMSPWELSSSSTRLQAEARSRCDTTGTTSVAAMPRWRQRANASLHSDIGWRRKYWLQKLEPT